MIRKELTVENNQEEYLVLEGCFGSFDFGCPPWGTSNPKKINFIGDNLGRVLFRFADGSEAALPCVIGYTVWLHSIWNESPAPFFGNFRDEKLEKALKTALYPAGVWENGAVWKLYIKLNGKKALTVAVEDNPEKECYGVFLKAYGIPKEEVPADAKFPELTERVPEDVQAALDEITGALHTFSGDFRGTPVETADWEETAAFRDWSADFSGTFEAEVATKATAYNMRNLCQRTDGDGMIHTSYRNAPSWRYDGFGPYVAEANSYYDSFYSRDGARAIMTLVGFGETEKAAAACRFANGCAMYYPEHGLTLGGKRIPGHFSVVPNKPLLYSQILTKIGVPALCDDPDAQGAWPTRYVFSKFGKECENLGNQETDGHGLMMMANWLSWRATGKDKDYGRAIFPYLSEFSGWLVWCYENPELSFVENDLIYGETEAAMNTYTLYSNLPCLLGLRGAAELAEDLGEEDKALLWNRYADRLERAILRELSEDDGWNLKKTGFFHDPVPAFLADFYGYDTDTYPRKFLERSRKSYPEDLAKATAHGWYGAAGIGYDHCMMTQNALLLDQTEDYTRLVESLMRISYAPRLSDPYLVPEGVSVDVEKGIIRRQGDLGNLVQLAEAMKCVLLCLGVSPLEQDGTLRILPRLPLGWTAELRDFPLQNGDTKVDLTVSAPDNMTLHLGNLQEIRRVILRFGPFSQPGPTAVSLNGKQYSVTAEPSGDAFWGRLSLEQAEELSDLL